MPRNLVPKHQLEKLPYLIDPLSQETKGRAKKDLKSLKGFWQAYALLYLIPDTTQAVLNFRPTDLINVHYASEYLKSFRMLRGLPDVIAEPLTIVFEGL